jgi:anaerobic sulfite reductase subunit C
MDGMRYIIRIDMTQIIFFVFLEAYTYYMDHNGILAGRTEEKITMRIRALHPYSAEFTSDQIDVIAEIAERYGSGVVHVTPRQTVEIPDINRNHEQVIKDSLKTAGLEPGSTGRFLRNVIACSRWCLYSAIPSSDLANRINNRFAEMILPGKVNISLSGCDFSCVRSRTSDIGIIARSNIELTDKQCKKCTLCVKEPLGCQVDAIEMTDDGVVIDTDKCVRCGFCTNICKPGTIKVRFRSFDLYAGGCGGLKPKEAVFFKNIQSDDDLVNEVGALLVRYSEVAREGERIGSLIERMGIEALRS